MSNEHGAVEAALTLSHQAESLSLKDQLRAARKRADRRADRDFEIPGYEGRLWGTFRVLEEYGQIREIGRRVETISDEVDQELAIAADIITQSCVAVYAKLEDGSKEPLETRLGADLAQFLFDIDTPINDREGVFMIFPNTLSVAVFYAELDGWFTAASRESDVVVSGNSEAPSS